MNSYVLGLELIGRESQGVGPPFPQHHHSALHNQVLWGSAACPKDEDYKIQSIEKAEKPSSRSTPKSLHSQAATHL